MLSGPGHIDVLGQLWGQLHWCAFYPCVPRLGLGKQAQPKAHSAPSFQKDLLETEQGSVSETEGE